MVSSFCWYIHCRGRTSGGGDIVVVGVGHCFDGYFDVMDHIVDTQLWKRSALRLLLYVGHRGVLLYICEFPNVEVILAEKNEKVANRYKIYIREARR